MRRRYRQDPITHKLYEIGVNDHQAPGPKVYVRGDLEDFVSPVDHTVVHGRRSLREHNQKNGVVNYEEFGDSYFNRKREERDRYYKGEDPKQRKEWKEAYNDAVRKSEHGPRR